jgi:hypothetical protein
MRMGSRSTTESTSKSNTITVNISNMIPPSIHSDWVNGMNGAIRGW